MYWNSVTDFDTLLQMSFTVLVFRYLEVSQLTSRNTLSSCRPNVITV